MNTANGILFLTAPKRCKANTLTKNISAMFSEITCWPMGLPVSTSTLHSSLHTNIATTAETRPAAHNNRSPRRLISTAKRLYQMLKF